MKKAKKLISFLLILLIVITSSTVIAGASGNSVFVNNFNPLIRYWHYGAYPDKVSYTTGGYVILESSHYEQQHQVCFYGQPLQEQWNKLISETVNTYDGIAGFDVYVKDAHGTNKFEATDDTGHEQSAPGLNVIITYKYKEGDEVIEEDLLNFEAPVGQVGIGETKHFIFPIDDDYTQLDSFEITRVKVAVINYACLANENGEQGCGEFYVRFSPFYIEGTEAPEIGEELGENFNDSLYSWETTDKVTSISQGNLTPDGPLHGGVDLKRNDKYLPYLADGVTVAKLNKDDADDTPLCKHVIKTTKVTKASTYFKTGTKSTVCVLCNKVLSNSVLAKKVLAKPSVKASGKKKSVKLTWKKVKDATGYTVEMKSGKKYKVVKTINKGNTTSFTKTKLKKGTKYSFRVRAFVKSGANKAYSGYSSVKTAKAK